jgi:hypothetical protein
MKKRLFVILFTITTAAVAFSVDFGLVAGGEGGYAEALSPEGFSATGTLSPWFSALLTEKADLYVSGKMTLSYDENRGLEPFLFEAERTELNLRPVSALYLTLGRQRFGDPAALIASGFFDGLSGGVKFGICRLSLGAFYTGLLYKETAKIIMTAGDFERYQKPLDFPDLEGYFASRRLLVALTGEFPDLTPRTSLAVQGLAQFDLNGGADTLDTYYLELRYGAEPVDSLHLNLGGIGELFRESGGMRWSAAAFGGLDWEAPGTLADLVSAEIRWTGGKGAAGMRAFKPVSGKQGGRIFEAGMGALMSAGLSYRTRLPAGFSAEAGTTYFIRTDLETLGDGGLDGRSESRLLGGEVYGSLVWGPDAALRISAGGGAFFPQWGGAFVEGAPVRWKATLGVILSL